MIKKIVSIDGYHELYVAQAIERLQTKGYEVTNTTRIEKMKFGVFGTDVTNIEYHKSKK